jgi:uncharacterized PurR-regulated membrane protein YhhQ (DUF165 family)
MRTERGGRPKAYAVVVVVCLALLALLAVIQVAHVHPVNTDADHCPLCTVLHSAAPIAAAAGMILLVQIDSFTPVVEVRPIKTAWERHLFIRPPPRTCLAAF